MLNWINTLNKETLSVEKSIDYSILNLEVAKVNQHYNTEF